MPSSAGDSGAPRAPTPSAATASRPWRAPTRPCTIALSRRPRASMSAICGLLGTYAERPSAEADLAAMLEALAARAPDEATTWHDPAGPVRLGFRWLHTQPGETNPGIEVTGGGAMAMACDGHVFADG